MDMLTIAVEPDLSYDDFLDILHRSTLAERRPVNNEATIKGMLKHPSLIVTARDAAGRLIGVSRSVTDFHFCCYLSDLCVDINYQKQGIGKKLIAFTHEKAGGPERVTLLLLSQPAAMDYYPRAGLQAFSNCFGARRSSTDGYPAT